MIAREDVVETLIPAVRNVSKKVQSHYTPPYPDEEGLNGYLALKLADQLDEQSRRKGSIQTCSTPYKKTEEKKSGADLGVRYQLLTDDYLAEAGFIAQCKKHNNYDDQLPKQCLKMLTRTNESYIFQYSDSGLWTYPALPVYYDEGQGGQFNYYYGVPFVYFLTGFFMGFFGEPTIARNIGNPSEVGPRATSVKYLLDIKVAAEDTIIDDESFDSVYQDYIRLSGDEWSNFEQ